MRRIRPFLEDILDSMNKIQLYTRGLAYEDFVASGLVVDAVLRNLEVIGEAARYVPEETRRKTPQIPWTRMMGLRNVVIHRYFGVDLRLVWQVVTVNLPDTRPLIEALLAETGGR